MHAFTATEVVNVQVTQSRVLMSNQKQTRPDTQHIVIAVFLILEAEKETTTCVPEKQKSKSSYTATQTRKKNAL
jgi:hypothetical protein